MIFGILGSGYGDFLSGIRALIKEGLLLWRIAMWKTPDASYNIAGSAGIRGARPSQLNSSAVRSAL